MSNLYGLSESVALGWEKCFRYHYMPGGSLKNYVGAYEGGFKGGLPEGQGKFTEAKGRKVFEVNLYHSPRGSHNNRTFHFSHLWSESRASTKEERGKVENTQTSCLLQLTPVPALWYPLPNINQFHSDLDFLCIKYSLEIDTWHWPRRTIKQWK